MEKPCDRPMVRILARYPFDFEHVRIRDVIIRLQAYLETVPPEYLDSACLVAYEDNWENGERRYYGEYQRRMTDEEYKNYCETKRKDADRENAREYSEWLRLSRKYGKGFP